jgi:hypothetical protein
VGLHRHRVHHGRNLPRDQHVEGKGKGRAQGPQRHQAEGTERGLDHQKRADKAHDAGSDPARPDLVAKEEAAQDQQDERLDEDDGQRIGQRHHLDARDEGEGGNDQGGEAIARLPPQAFFVLAGVCAGWPMSPDEGRCPSSSPGYLVGRPLLVRPVGLEVPVEDVVGNHRPFAVILRLSTAFGPRP